MKYKIKKKIKCECGSETIYKGKKLTYVFNKNKNGRVNFYRKNELVFIFYLIGEIKKKKTHVVMCGVTDIPNGSTHYKLKIYEKKKKKKKKKKEQRNNKEITSFDPYKCLKDIDHF